MGLEDDFLRVGVAVPQTIASDTQALGAFVEGIEELGYAHALVFDHVVGAARGSRPAWNGPYDLADPFHEPFVLLSWIAARTRAIGLVTGVLVLPQRQTVLVAKQAAELDLLSGGRLRLGVGVGWNTVEYEALGVPFGSRGRRIEEQVHLMRRLWTEPDVTFDGEWDHVQAAGLNPGPLQRPIPIWLGGSADAVVERSVRLADGWMPMLRPAEAASRLARIAPAPSPSVRRILGPVAVEGRVTLRSLDPAQWVPELVAWQELGATHATVNTSGLGLPGPEAHLDLLHRLRTQTEGDLDWEVPRRQPSTRSR